jgi:CheY-like chemotaxis protein
MTAHALVEERQRCLDAGMNDHVSKPIDPDVLFSTLMRWAKPLGQGKLPSPRLHVVFTVPHELNVLLLENPRLFYDLLFTASAQTLLEIASDAKHLGAEIGVIAILHTWGQNRFCIPTFTVSFPRVGSRGIVVGGSARAILSSYPSKY